LIWRRKLSWVSYSYAFLRYTGLFWVIAVIFTNVPIAFSDHVCYVLCILLYAVLQTVQMIVVQGIMTARVCALYGTSKKVGIFLSACFIVMIMVSIATCVISYAPPYGVYGGESIFLGIRACLIFSRGPALTWVNPLSAGVSLAFELLLTVMVVYRSLWKLNEHRKQSRAIGIHSIVDLIVQHSVLFFLGTLAAGIINALLTDPYTGPLDTMILEDISPALDTIITCMMGPWLILSIREYHGAQFAHDSNVGGVLSSLAFGGAPDSLVQNEVSATAETLDHEKSTPSP